MTTKNPLDVLFIWHLHQPYYRAPSHDEFTLPWVRLHAVKAYYDMARLLEKRPQIRATFNFSGSLLRQLVELSDMGMRDRWWRWSKTEPDALSLGQKRAILRNFFSINHDRAIYPHPRYAEILNRRKELGIAGAAKEFSRQDFLDLQTFFNLVWCGFTAREDFPLIQDLLRKGRDFTVEDRDALLDLHLDITAKILPLYRDLAARGQIEISVTPMFHPILPLLIDTESAARATPDRPRPEPYRAPEDARWHIHEALELAKACFGTRPVGIWPSEGSVSPEAVELFAEAGIQWIGTDDEILRCSRGDAWQRSPDLFRPWTLEPFDSPRIFFRDHGLSDQIGFVYSNNPANEAADDLIQNLKNIRAGTDGDALVAIILDGENPWEYYEDDGRPFLTALYERLETTPELQTSLPSQLTHYSPGKLTDLHSGSWIMGNFQIWIGHEETNAAWNWVRRAAAFLEERRQANPEEPGLHQAQEALHIAQGSDWFWWYGDDFSSEQDDQFDALFRALIAQVWSSFDETPPQELGHPIHAQGLTTVDQQARISLPRRYISPFIDGQIDDFFGWLGAGQILIAGGQGAMYENFRPLEAAYFGFSRDEFFLRLDPGPDFTDQLTFQVHLSAQDSPESLNFTLGPNDIQAPGARAAFARIGELAIPLDLLALEPGQNLSFWISVERSDLNLQRFPARDAFLVRVPIVDPSRENWLI